MGVITTSLWISTTPNISRTMTITTHHFEKGQVLPVLQRDQARASENQERHDFTESIDAQIGNNRFYVAETCDECGYETSEYVTAKSVVAAITAKQTARRTPLLFPTCQTAAYIPLSVTGNQRKLQPDFRAQLHRGGILPCLL